MGIFSWPMRIASLDGEQTRDIQATVDTGARYTVVPANLLRELGITPNRRSVFELGDGRRVEMDIGEARATVDGVSAVTPVIFGTDGTEPLLGAMTLQILNFAVDTPSERLVPGGAIQVCKDASYPSNRSPTPNCKSVASCAPATFCPPATRTRCTSRVPPATATSQPLIRDRQQPTRLVQSRCSRN